MFTKRIYKIFYALIAISLLPGLAFNYQASASAPQADNSVAAQQEGLTVTKKSTASQQSAALAFWTKEELANAEPFPMPVDYGSSAVESALQNDPFAFAAPGSSAPGMAAGNSNGKARAAYPDEWSGNGTQAAALDVEAEGIAGTSQVYTSYVVNQWAPAQKVYPHRWVGRVSFKTPNGTSYCSATAISGNNIVTAAHCVFDTTNNIWYSNIVFTPAYRNGNAPYGTFAWSACTILTTWVNLSGNYSINSWARHDVAVCSLKKNSAGQTLNQAVGWAGRQWNQAYVRHFHTMGYPFRDTSNLLLPNAGAYLRTCAAESFQQTSRTRGMGCNLGGGISGGPWLTSYAPPNVSGFVDGVNSGIFIGSTNIYGARFDNSNIVPLCTARGC